MPVAINIYPYQQDQRNRAAANRGSAGPIRAEAGRSWPPKGTRSPARAKGSSRVPNIPPNWDARAGCPQTTPLGPGSHWEGMPPSLRDRRPPQVGHWLHSVARGCVQVAAVTSSTDSHVQGSQTQGRYGRGWRGAQPHTAPHHKLAAGFGHAMAPRSFLL